LDPAGLVHPAQRLAKGLTAPQAPSALNLPLVVVVVGQLPHQALNRLVGQEAAVVVVVEMMQLLHLVALHRQAVKVTTAE
jgi:hypothetical protein